MRQIDTTIANVPIEFTRRQIGDRMASDLYITFGTPGDCYTPAMTALLREACRKLILGNLTMPPVLSTRTEGNKNE
jgi:broad specificity polyphosphatase/5'/3'-nucleotidase SurE